MIFIFLLKTAHSYPIIVYHFQKFQLSLHSEPKDSFKSFWSCHNTLFITHTHDHDL